MVDVERITEGLQAASLDNLSRDGDIQNAECIKHSDEVKAKNPSEEDGPAVVVKVHPMTERQNSLYKELAGTKTWKENYRKLKLIPPKTPKKDGNVRFVCISDTHNRHANLDLPDGDILLHAGDFSWKGNHKEVENFCQFLCEIRNKYKHIVLIAGNHELTFDDKEAVLFGLFKKHANHERGAEFKNMLKKHCIYLEDEEVELMGFRIYGSPWQPYHRGWAFNLPRGEALLEKWNKIPDGIDVLVTHGPPLGHGDLTFFGQHVGCAELLSTIQERVKPKLNVFGHIHEGHGMSTDGTTTFINAAICNFRFQPVQPPIIFDLPLKY